MNKNIVSYIAIAVLFLSLLGHWYLNERQCDVAFYKHAAVVFHTEIEKLEKDLAGYMTTLVKLDSAIGELIESDESGHVVQVLIRHKVGLIEQ